MPQHHTPRKPCRGAVWQHHPGAKTQKVEAAYLVPPKASWCHSRQFKLAPKTWPLAASEPGFSTLIPPHTCVHIHTQPHAHIHIYTCKHTHAPTYMCTLARTHTDISSILGRFSPFHQAFAHSGPFSHPSCKAPAPPHLPQVPFSKKSFLNAPH